MPLACLLSRGFLFFDIFSINCIIQALKKTGNFALFTTNKPFLEKSMFSAGQRLNNMIELQVFLFGGMPEGRHRERHLQRQLREQPPCSGVVLGTCSVNFETGEIDFCNADT